MPGKILKKERLNLWSEKFLEECSWLTFSFLLLFLNVKNV